MGPETVVLKDPMPKVFTWEFIYKYLYITGTCISICTTGTTHWTTTSSLKSISGITLHGNAPGNIKYPYFDTIILHFEKLNITQKAMLLQSFDVIT